MRSAGGTVMPKFDEKPDHDELYCCICGKTGTETPFGFALCKEHDTQLAHGMEEVMCNRSYEHDEYYSNNPEIK